MKSLALVVPCKDEARRLVVSEFLNAIHEHPYLTLLFVDDGSMDSTAETLAFLERESPSIRALYLPVNVGKAEAVRRGVNWLLKNTKCETVGFWDADLATPFSELDAFVGAMEANPSCVAAIGARWPHLGVQIDRSAFRHFTGQAMKLLIRLMLNIPVYDTQCGAKIFRRDIAADIFRTPFMSRWLFDVELLRRMSSADLRRCVTEIPLSFWRDVEGSKLTARDAMHLLPDLVRIAMTSRPAAEFSIPMPAL